MVLRIVLPANCQNVLQVQIFCVDLEFGLPNLDLLWSLHPSEASWLVEGSIPPNLRLSSLD